MIISRGINIVHFRMEPRPNNGIVRCFWPSKKSGNDRIHVEYTYKLIHRNTRSQNGNVKKRIATLDVPVAYSLNLNFIQWNSEYKI